MRQICCCLLVPRAARGGSHGQQRTHALRPVGEGDTGIAVVEEGWRFDAEPVLACERVNLSLLGSLLGLGKSLVCSCGEAVGVPGQRMSCARGTACPLTLSDSPGQRRTRRSSIALAMHAPLLVQSPSPASFDPAASEQQQQQHFSFVLPACVPALPCRRPGAGSPPSTACSPAAAAAACCCALCHGRRCCCAVPDSHDCDAI